MEKMNVKDVNDILKILGQHNKKDLITKIRIHFEDILDEDYEPLGIVRKNRYSDSEGSAEEEEEYCFQTDEHGLLSLV